MNDLYERKEKWKWITTFYLLIYINLIEKYFYPVCASAIPVYRKVFNDKIGRFKGISF